MKKLISGMLFVILILTGLTGCKGGREKYDPENFIADTSSAQILKTKKTIKMFAPKSTFHGQWEDMTIFKWMEERTNIHVEFEEVTLESYQEKRGLKWESGKDMVDAFFLANNADEVTAASALGALTKLNDDSGSDSYSGNYGNLIKNYMPNYSAWIDKYEGINVATTQLDGGMYSFSSVSTLHGGFAQQYLNVEWLNKTDWYSANQRMPETIEELEIVFDEFLAKDMNGNGDRFDEIPISYFTSDQTRNFIMSAYGFVGTGIELDKREQIKKDGVWIPNPTYNQIVWVPSTDAYREYVKTLRRWYEKGIIDINIYENNQGKLANKGEAGRLGCFSSASAFLVVGENKSVQYEPIGPLTSSQNKQKMWLQFNSKFDPSIMVIPSSSPYKREIARWLDVFYDEANVAIQSFGIENVNWEWDTRDNGEKCDGSLPTDSWTFIVPAGSEREIYRATLTYSAGLGGRILETDFIDQESTPMQRKVQNDKKQYIDYLVTMIPPLKYTGEQMDKITRVEASLGSVMSSSEAFFITDVNNEKKEFDPTNDSHWQTYIVKMKNAGNIEIRGYEALVAQYQAAYNVFFEKHGLYQE